MRRHRAVSIEAWVDELESRHLRDLTFAEARRGLQALSSLYVERRRRLAEGRALDGAGKRAAFALYYAPLHLVLVRAIVRSLGAASPTPTTVVDLGCGTVAAGCAWGLESGRRPEIRGIDRNAWAVEEGRWNLRTLGLRGRVERGDLLRGWRAGLEEGVVAAFVVNELPREIRDRLLVRLLEAGRAGARVLVVEAIARGPVPWWPSWAAAFEAAGGRDDTWRFPAEFPDKAAGLGRAAGLMLEALTGRSLYMQGSRSGTV